MRKLNEFIAAGYLRRAHDGQFVFARREKAATAAGGILDGLPEETPEDRPWKANIGDLSRARATRKDLGQQSVKHHARETDGVSLALKYRRVSPYAAEN